MKNTILGLALASAGIAGGSGVFSYDPANPNTRLAKLPHIDTPKPMSKRRKRRLRGRAKGDQA